MASEISEIKKAGIGLIGFGIFFSFLGILLFFDRGLLALGNIFWLAGVALLPGWRSTLNLFTNRENYKGSVPFLQGLFFIFVWWPILVVLGHLSKCSSIIFRLSDGLYGTFLLHDGFVAARKGTECLLLFDVSSKRGSNFALLYFRSLTDV